MKRAALLASMLVTLLGTSATAQEPVDEAKPDEVLREEPDSTRLDVSRLPPEAATLTRDLYAHGFLAEASIGALGFVGDAGKAVAPGPRLTLGFGYEIASWVSVLLQAEGSLHNTINRAPPAHSSVEIAGGSAAVRLGIPFNAQAMLWGAGAFGVVWTAGDVLHALGFDDAFKLGLQYGGELGFDWHFRSPHHSLGLLGGARLMPSLEKTGTTVGVYGASYLRYVL